MLNIKRLLKNKFVVYGVLPAVVILGVVVFWLYREMIFSKEIVKLELFGPQLAAMGEEVEYKVVYKNNGNFTLEKPRLTVLLPEHSLTEDGKERLTQAVSDLYPGQESVVKFKIRLLGKEDDTKTVRAVFSYIPHNLSVRYESETTFTTRINEVPITLTYDAPLKAERGKEISYSINYFSSVDYPLENLTIRLEPVPGFTIKSSDPVSLDTSAFDLDVLQKGQGGRISIKGVIGEGATSPMVFSARLGMWVDGVFVVVKEAKQEIETTQALLSVSQEINGTSSYVASPGETLRYEVVLRNLAPTPSENIFVLVRLDGSAFDMATMQSIHGQVRPNERTIAFDSRLMPELARLQSQQEVKINFTVALKNSWTPSDSEKSNTLVKNTVTVAGISQEFTAKVNSRLEMTQKASAGGGSYQIIWQVKNYFNHVGNVKIRAQLSEGVTLNDTLIPESEADHFSFDSRSREIVWLAGSVAAGTGVTTAPLTLMFEVSAPSLPGLTLLGQAIISGEDKFTGQVVSSSVPPVVMQ